MLSAHGVMIALLGLGGRNISDGFEQAAVVEPVNPFEGRVFPIFATAHVEHVRHVSGCGAIGVTGREGMR